MDKLLLTLTLVAFSSGVLCNVAQNRTEGGPAADSVLPRIKVLGGHKELYSSGNKCCTYNVPGDYKFLTDNGAFKLHKNRLSWNQARESCMEDGAQLAVINSNAEGTKLVNWLKEEGIHGAWIGAHDMFEQGHWVTLTGETLAEAGYDHWLPGEPNNAGGNEHCGILVDTNGMNDLTCSYSWPYFCKIIQC